MIFLSALLVFSFVMVFAFLLMMHDVLGEDDHEAR